jgi:hypothetical protein
VIDNLLILSGLIVLTVQAFKVRRILNDYCANQLHTNVQFSGAATFFFGLLYLQYKINRLIESGEPLSTAEASL